MNATDIAKDIVRILNTATLGKDVIDLLEKKLTLLTEEITRLRPNVSSLEAENASLKTQLQCLQPAGGGLGEDTLKVLRFFFAADREVSIPQVAQHFAFQMSVAQKRRGFVRQSRIVRGDPSGYFELLPDGRKYVMENPT